MSLRVGNRAEESVQPVRRSNAHDIFRGSLSIMRIKEGHQKGAAV